MGYEPALLKGWAELKDIAKELQYPVKFLSDEYTVNLNNNKVLSLSCNIPAKDYTAIIILHYLTKRLEGLPHKSGEWMLFNQLPGGQGYHQAFKKRVIETIIRKHSTNPEGLYEATGHLNAKRAQLADISVVLDVFEGVPILINLWRGDEEFGPEANLLFDRSITDIFCTEDIVVLSEMVAHNL